MVGGAEVVVQKNGMGVNLVLNDFFKHSERQLE
jgi:hypothetical protein